MRMTMKKLTRGATRLLVLALGLGLASTGWAAVSKPLAIWNGDFVDGDKRGPITLNRNNHTIAADKSKITIGTGTTKGGVLFQSDTGYSKIGAVISLANVTTSSAGVSGLMGIKSNDQNCRVWTGIKTGAYNLGTWKNGGSGNKGPDGYPTWPNDKSRNYLGMISEHNSDANDGTGTSVYLNKTQVISGAYTAKSDKTGSKLSGVSAGGYWGNNSNNWSAPNSWTDFVAIFNASDEETVQYWSLTDMTSAATFTDGETIATGTDYTHTGINLNGGTITVFGEITAAAIFVQADTTLSMAAGTDKLVSTGPIYIANGVTLTINVTANPTGYVAGTTSNADLITGTLFVSGSYVIAGDLAAVSDGKAKIVTDTTNNKIMWAYVPMPVWNDGAWIGGNAPDADTTEIIIKSTTSSTYNAGNAGANAYDTVYVQGSSTLNIGANGLNVTTLSVDADSTVNMANITATTVTGSGTVIYDSDSVTPVATDGNWRGTVWFKNRSFNGLNPNAYGNANSVLKFTGVTGWLQNGTTVTVPVELEDDGDTVALTFGYSTAPSSTLTFNKLQGSGTFKTNGSAWPQVNHVVLDWSSFTGSLNIDRGRFVFGSGSYTTDKWRNICIGANASVELSNSATWKSYTGFVIGAGATLTANGTLSCEGASDNDVPNPVSGSGRVVFTGMKPTPSGGKWWTTSGWTGTVELRDYDISGTSGDAGYTTADEFNSWGNASSTLCFSGVTGYTPKGCTISIPVELKNSTTTGKAYGLYHSNGWAETGALLTIATLKGNGKLKCGNAGDQQPILIQNWGNFTGSLNMDKHSVYFGGDAPTSLGATGAVYIRGNITFASKQEFVVAALNIASGCTVDLIANSGYVEASSITLDGKIITKHFKNTGVYNSLVPTSSLVINDTGVLELKDSGKDDSATDFSLVTGTGTIRYAGNTFRTFPDQKPFADTLTVELEQAEGVVYKGSANGTLTIGSIFGTKNLRSDLSDAGKTLIVKQAKDGVWSGVFKGGTDRLATFQVDPGASTTGTLTIAGTQDQSGWTDNLVVNGSVNLTGRWQGTTTVAGTFGGTGTLDGALTFSAGSTFKAFASDENGLSVTGTVSYPESGTVTVDVEALGSPESDVVLISKAGLAATKFTLKSGSPAGYTLAVEDNALKLKTPAPVTITVPVIANTTVTVTVGGVEQVGVDGDGVKTYSIPYGSAVVVTYAAVSGYKISGTDTYQIASATTDATIAVDQDLSSDLIVATFNGTSYTALQVAVDAWAGADVGIAFMNPVVLTADVTENVTIPVNANVAAVPLQMQGSATINGTVAISSGAIFQPLATVQFGGDVVVTGTLVRAGVTTLSIGGDLTLADGATLGTTALDVVDPVYAVTGAIEVEGILNISLTSSTLEAGTYKVVTGASVTRDEAADVVVFLNAVENNNWVLNSTSTELNITGAAAMVDGEKFTSFTDAVTAAAGSKTIELLASASYTLSVGEILIVEAGSFTMTVTAPEGYAVAQSGSGVVTYTTQKYVARLQNPQDGTSTYQPAVDYTSLAAAVADVTERSAGYYGGGDAIVTLLDDVALDATVTVSKKMILNMNGKALTANGFAAINNSTKLTVQGSSGSISVTSGGSVVLTDAAATLTVSGVTLSPTPTTTVANHHVVNNAGVYTVALDQFVVTVPSVANTTVSVSYTSGGASQVATAAGDIMVDYGTDVTATWTAASGYKITSGASQTLNAVTSAQTLASPTVEAMGATVSDVSVSYGADYASATVTATVSDTTLDYYISWANGEPVKGSVSVSGSQVTFDVSGINHTTEYQSAGYTITAKDGEAAVTTTGGSGTSVAADTTPWFSQSSANSGAPVNGSWATAVNLAEPATVEDNTFTAAAESTSSRVVLEFNVCFTATNDANVDGDAQGAIKLGEENSATTFMVLAQGGGWTAVSNDALTPNPAATYKVVMTFDYANNTYAASVNDYVLTNASGFASFPLAASKTSVQTIDFAGSGTLTSMKGDQVEGYMVVDKNGTRYSTIDAAIAAYNANPTIGPLKVLHAGTAPSGWSIVSQGGIDILKKLAKGFFFMAY